MSRIFKYSLIKKLISISILGSLLLLVAISCVSTAHAYVLWDSKWPQPSTTFYVNIPGEDDLWNDAFEGAMYEWGVATVFQFHIVRETYSDPCSSSDDRNGVGFSSTDCGDAWGGTTLAITTSWSVGNTTTQTDIVFNSNEPWDVYSTSWQYSVNDFRRVAVHELGHALGLDHEDSGVSTIMGTYVGDNTIPQQDDINGVAAIYGGDTIYTLYYPHIASNSNWETEICVVNGSSSQSLNGQFVAYSNSGEQVTSLSVTLSPNGRREVTVGSELSNPGSIGYIIFESDSDSACGYTKFYQEGKSRVAIPSTSEINTGDIYISHIASNAKWWTGVSLLNTTSSPRTISIEFDDGTTKTKTISAKEHQVFTIKSLFGGISQPSIKSAVIKNVSGIVGLELFGSIGSNGDSYLSGILLKDETTSNIYYPHIASNAKWWTGIVAYNPSDSSSALTITPYNAEGTELSSQILTLDPQEKYIGSAKALNFPDGSAWFKVTSTSPIAGFELFGTNDGKQLGGYSGVGINGTSGVFAKNETEDGWTGIVFVNIEDSATTITMTAYNDSGNVVATESLSLNGYEKVVSVAPGLFSGDISSATYISYSSTGEVVGFQLNGSTDGMMLDALPGM